MDFSKAETSGFGDARSAAHSVESRATGERVLFTRTAAETGGELLEMENHWSRPDHATPEHVHPGMEESWEVVSGRVAFRIDGAERICGPGERAVAPAGVPHSARNVGDAPAHLRIEMRPALRWQELVERLFAHDAHNGDQASLVALLREFPEEIAIPEAEHGNR